MIELKDLEISIGHVFTNKRLLLTSLVHRSYLHEKDKDQDVTEQNERLEFLGDAVLELVVTDYLYAHVKEKEGVLTALRASLVNYKIMGRVGIEIGLNDYILLSRGEREDNGRARLSIIANAMEAIIGAIYLDGGIRPAEAFIKKYILSELPEIIEKGSFKDPKTMLQEFAQKYTKITPHYKVVSSSGKDHERVFTVGVWIQAEQLARGTGHSKQEAETEAAEEALHILKKKYTPTLGEQNKENTVEIS